MERDNRNAHEERRINIDRERHAKRSGYRDHANAGSFPQINQHEKKQGMTVRIQLENDLYERQSC